MTRLTEQFPLCTHLFVVDFEATCGPGVSAGDVEIIEFGGLLVPLQTIIDPADGVQFHHYIQPVKHPSLTRFCRQLTGVTQEQVDTAEPFLTVLQKLEDWFQNQSISLAQTVFTAWSTFDAQQLRRECLHHERPMPFVHFLDLQRAFKRTQQHTVNHSVSKALESVGLEFEGRKHSAIDDALNTARLLPYSGYLPEGNDCSPKN